MQSGYVEFLSTVAGLGGGLGAWFFFKRIEKRLKGPAWWPEILDQESAKQAATRSWMMAFLVAIFNAVLGLVADPSDWASAVAYGLLGMFIWRKTSRIAAVLVLLLYIGDRIFTWATRPPVNGIFIYALAAALASQFVAGVRGTFAYHRYAKEQSQPLCAEGGD